MGREATDSSLHRCEIRCITRAAGASLRAEEKEARAKKKGRKKGSGATQNARDSTTRGETLPFRRFSALVPSRGAIRVQRQKGGEEERGEEERRAREPEKWGPRRGHVSRPGHLPLKRTHCYVPIISFTLAANHLPFSPFFFFLPSFLPSASDRRRFTLTTDAYEADVKTFVKYEGTARGRSIRRHPRRG